MAQPTSSRNALITLGIAAATLVVVLGVLTGPSIVECSSDGEGLGTCLRGKIDGLMGVPPVVVAEPETPAAPVPDAEVAAEEAPAPASPSLGLLNTEADGAVVVAGTAAPGEEVSIYANGKLFGTAKAEATGDWAFMPSEKLLPGGTEITAGGPDKSLASQAFVVIIDKDPAIAPQVIASVPGKAVEVLKGVPLATRSTDAVQPQVAATPEAEAAGPQTAAPAPDAPSTETPVAAPAPAEPETAEPVIDVAAIDAGRSAAEEAIGNPVTVIAVLPAPALAEPVVDEAAIAAGVADAVLAAANPVTPPSPVDAAATAAGAAAALAAVASPIEAADIPAMEDIAAGPELADTRAAFEAGRAAAESAAGNPVAQRITVAAVAPEPVVAPPMSQPTIEAIEIDGATDYFAGAGEEGATVRIYVDGALAGETSVKDGRYLVESTGTLTQPSQRVRADMLPPGSDTVGATASVDFVIDLPVASEAPAVAETAAEPVPSPSDSDAIEAGRAAAEAAMQAPAEQTEPQIDVAAIDAGRTAAEAALTEPAMLETGPEIEVAAAPPVEAVLEAARSTDTAARDAGRAAAILAMASPVSQTVAITAPPAVEQAVEPVAKTPEVDTAALEAGRMAAEVAAANPQSQSIAAIELPVAEPVADSIAPVDLAATEAGAAAAEEALTAPQAAVGALAEAPGEPVVETAVAEADTAAIAAGSRAAEAALADPRKQVVAVAEMPVEPVVEPPADPGSDVAAVEAGRSAAETAAANPEPEIVAEVPPDEPSLPVEIVAETAVENEVEAATEPEQVAVAETPEAIEEIPTIHAGPMTAADLRMFSNGKVIIRRGDTLWDIARRVYGNPYRYRSIYRANRNIVRRPSRIYPGQVLVLPEIADKQN